MDILSVLFAILAGFCTAIEQTINGRLGREITPSLATLHNLMTGGIVMLGINALRGNISNYTKIADVNPVLLIGGVFGAAIIYLTAKAVPALGVTKTLVLVIAGQLTCGFVTDVFLNNVQIDATKWIGIVLLLAGTYFMLR